MSLEALASEHCANWQAGKCTGTETHVDGVETRFLPEGTRCLLAQGKQCRYFEVAVLPMEHWDWKSRRKAGSLPNLPTNTGSGIRSF